MSKNLLSEINEDYFRESFKKYTRKAFQMLPELDRPRILDIGCGSGVPTIELTKLSNGEIIGIDNDQALLDKLNSKIEEAGLSNRIKTIKCSLFEMDFPDESFDIIWAEGVINIIGFERGLKEWNRLLKIKGFLVVHDEKSNSSDKLKKISDCGYKLINTFTLPQDSWWIDYYKPLENRIKKLRIKYKDYPEAPKIFRHYQNEIDMVKNNRETIRSMFFVLQKL